MRYSAPLRVGASVGTLLLLLLLGERLALRAGGAPDDTALGRASLLMLAGAAAARATRRPGPSVWRSALPLALLVGSALLQMVATPRSTGAAGPRGWAAWGACALLVAAWPRSPEDRVRVALTAACAGMWTIALAGAGGLRVAPTYLAWTGAVAGVAGSLAWAAVTDDMQRAHGQPDTPVWPLQAWGALVSASTVVLCAWLDAPLYVPGTVIGWGFLARAWAGRHPDAPRLPLAVTTGVLVMVATGWALA